MFVHMSADVSMPCTSLPALTSSRQAVNNIVFKNLFPVTKKKIIIIKKIPSAPLPGVYLHHIHSFVYKCFTRNISAEQRNIYLLQDKEAKEWKQATHYFNKYFFEFFIIIITNSSGQDSCRSLPSLKKVQKNFSGWFVVTGKNTVSLLHNIIQY